MLPLPHRASSPLTPAPLTPAKAPPTAASMLANVVTLLPTSPTRAPTPADARAATRGSAVRGFGRESHGVAHGARQWPAIVDLLRHPPTR